MLTRFTKILLVDDSATARKIMRLLLHRIGYDNIVEAPNGLAALAALKGTSFRLIISDWDMAPMDGAELLAAVRSDIRLKQTPFIMATAQSQKRFLEIARDNGATYFLPKPFTTEMLSERLARIDDWWRSATPSESAGHVFHY